MVKSKVCTECGKEYPATIEYFHIQKRKDGRYYLIAKCKICKNNYKKQWYKNNKDKVIKKQHLYYRKHKENYRNKKYQHHYGLSLEQYNQMALSQNGVCIICKKGNPNGNKLSVDHNHKTGKVRGLLCQRCNLVIGELNEDIILVLNIKKYLKRG